MGGPPLEIVSPKKLVKRLRREATASPRKAAILGLLALAAMYFWLPLFRGMVVKKDTPVTSSIELPAELSDRDLGVRATARAAAPAATSGGAAPQEHSWEQLAGWLEQDERTRPAEDLAGRRSPFEPIREEPVETSPDLVEEEPVETVETVETVVTPGSLGMQLTGTVVGPGRHVAVIDGKAYAQGRIVGSVKDGQAIEFTLAEVSEERIVLERQGQRYELAIPQRAASGQIESIRTRNEGNLK